MIVNLFAPGLPLTGKSDTEGSVEYAYGLPNVGTYWGEHPYASNYGTWKGKARQDDLAAFGVGAGLGVGALANGKRFTGILKKLFMDEDALNRFGKLNKKDGKIKPGALTFVPEWGGFDTSTCASCGKTYAGKKTAIQYFWYYLEPSWQKARRNNPSTTPGLDQWLMDMRENYKIPTEPLP